MLNAVFPVFTNSGCRLCGMILTLRASFFMRKFK
nr:MAG TPA: Lentiviral Tat protein [Caudoviricetes sp.]